MKISFLTNQAMESINNNCETVIDEYFLRLNKDDFAAVAELFSLQGLLCPPFEKTICGRDAIASYLESEAKGMTCLPKSRTVKSGSNGDILYQIEGNVKTSFFSVNVRWSIHLNSQKEITFLEVKLLNKLQDLVAFRY
jgi:hypothetical protein